MPEKLRFEEKPRVPPVATRRKVLEAAAELLDGPGYPCATIEAIAAKAGVAKTTIYRWWPSKAAVLLDLFDTISDKTILDPESGNVVTDLKIYLKALRELMTGTVAGKAAAGMAAEAHANPQMKDEIWAHFSQFRQAVVREIIDRALVTGEIRNDIGRGQIDDLVTGTFWYRLLTIHSPMSAEECDAHVDAVLSGLAP